MAFSVSVSNCNHCIPNSNELTFGFQSISKTFVNLNMDCVLKHICRVKNVKKRRQWLGLYHSSMGIADVVTDIIVIADWFDKEWYHLATIQLIILIISNIWQCSSSYAYSYGMIFSSPGRNPFALCFGCCGLGHVFTLWSNWHDLGSLKTYHRYILVRACETLLESIPCGMYFSFSICFFLFSQSIMAIFSALMCTTTQQKKKRITKKRFSSYLHPPIVVTQSF